VWAVRGFTLALLEGGRGRNCPEKKHGGGMGRGPFALRWKAWPKTRIGERILPLSSMIGGLNSWLGVVFRWGKNGHGPWMGGYAVSQVRNQLLTTRKVTPVHPGNFWSSHPGSNARQKHPRLKTAEKKRRQKKKLTLARLSPGPHHPLVEPMTGKVDTGPGVWWLMGILRYSAGPGGVWCPGPFLQ